ncbi:GlxA family transcriptional regulator [Mesorhizobium sp. M0243]
MMSFASATEPLRAANRVLGREAFVWELCTVDGSPVTASNGVVFSGARVDGVLARSHALFVCGGVRVDRSDQKPYLTLLRRAARLGVMLGALSTASYLLAKAGLLDGYRCTIHWENRSAFEEEFPNIRMSYSLYELDRNRLTCSGGTAAMDMMLHIIADRYGLDIARAVANQFHHERIRDAQEDQQGGRLQQFGALPPPMQTAIRAMQENIESPIGIKYLATHARVSPRQLERQFNIHLGISPARYYLSLRVERARELLIYTEQPVTDISLAAGFGSASHLSRWFREFYNIRPMDLRRSANLRSAYTKSRIPEHSEALAADRDVKKKPS